MSDAFTGLSPLAFRRLAHMVRGADFKSVARWMCRPYATFLRYGDTGAHGRRCKPDVVAHVALLAALSRRGLLGEVLAEAQALANEARTEAISLRADLGSRQEVADPPNADNPEGRAGQNLLDEAIRSLAGSRADLVRVRSGFGKNAP